MAARGASSRGDGNAWEPGATFKDGRLLLFEARRLTLIRGWPEPLARARTPDGPWRAVLPRERLVHPYRRRRKAAPADGQLALPFAEGPPAPRATPAQARRRALDAFRFALPRDLARAVERFPRDQFPLLELAAAAPAGLDLLAANPALGFALAHHRRLREQAASRAELAALLARRQTQVLAWLGFPDTPAVARTLRKLEPESLRVEGLAHLRELTRRDELRRELAHLPRFNTGTLALLADDELRAHATPQLLAGVADDARERYRADTAGRLRDALALAQVVVPRRRVGRLRSRDQLESLHHELAERYVAQNASRILEYRFPAPPRPAGPGIVPLTRPAQLLEEGQRQRNCVASYARAVAAGEVYVYRVTAPARATLALRPSAHGRWYVSELLGPCNQRVPPALERAVERWLGAQDDDG